MAKSKSKYKQGDVLITKSGTIITVKLIFFCNGCKNNHYQLSSKVNKLYSHPVPYFDAANFIIPPTKAAKVLYGTSER